MDPRQLLSILSILGLIVLLSYLPVSRADGFFQSTSIAKTDQAANGLLDTFSLSFVGNFNFANAIEGITKIIEGISSFIDLGLIRATIDVFVDRFVPFGGSNNHVHYNSVVPDSRIDVVQVDEVITERKEVLKEEITSFVGAVLNKQECWQRTACQVGERTQRFAARDVVFLMVERLIPSWQPTLDLVKMGSTGNITCKEYLCDPSHREHV